MSTEIKPEVRSVGVIGAGQMGAGIAQVAAVAGMDVILNDISADQLSHAVSQIAAHTQKLVEKDKLTASDRKHVLPRISTTQDLNALGGCDLIIEAATENEHIKSEIFAKLCPHLAPHTILTSNTSSLSITRLASGTDRPEQFMGFHFMNPVPLMPLVELIKGVATSQETFDIVHAAVGHFGKIAAHSEDFPGFMVNRILIPMINEAIYVLYEGVGTVRNIDASLNLGAGHPMGPLELADFIGLDTCLAIMNTLHTGLADTKYRPCPLLVKYVEAGWLGRKSGRGFYDYAHEDPVPTR